MTPLLKKPSLDAQEMRNYRPVSNLSFISSLVERIVVTQLMDYLTLNNLLPPLQSSEHIDDITLRKQPCLRCSLAADSQRVTLLALLDLSAAFNCVDHDILLYRLQSNFGLGGKVLDWLKR